MSEDPTGRGHRPDPQPRLRIAALTAVITGVVLLAAAAFLLSYSGIHLIALEAGVSPSLARIYPLIFDAMLVIACAAVLALRGSGWWARAYVWLCLLLLLAGVATGDALHAMGVALPARQARAAVAITPWALLLLAFGLLLAMLQHLRRGRLAAGKGRAAAAAPATPTVRVVNQPPGVGAAAGGGTGGPASRPGRLAGLGLAGAAPTNGAETGSGPGGPQSPAAPAGWARGGNTGAHRTVPPPRGEPETPLDQGPAHPPDTAGDGPEPAAEKPPGQQPDTGPPDTGPPDTGPPDTGPPETGPPETGPPETGPPGTAYPVEDAHPGDEDYDTDDYTEQGSYEPAEYLAEIADDAPAAGLADAQGHTGAADPAGAPGQQERP